MARGVAGAKQGNPEARRIADEALGVFADVFGSYAADRFGAAYGPTWRRDRGFRSNGIGAQVHAIGDPQELLGRLQAGPEFDRVFRPALRIASGVVFGLVRDLKEQRNDYVHRTRPWEAADSWRLVDRVATLLGAFALGAGEARDHLDTLALRAASIVAGDRSLEIDELRREYTESILSTTAHVDAAGINARVGSKVVQVRLEDVYVEPRLIASNEGGENADPLSPHDLLLTRRAVVLGGPGAGKSTLIRRLARMLALGGESGAPSATPVIVLATEFAEGLRIEPDLSLRRYVTQRLSERFGSLFADELELGRAVILLDGLDEVADESLRSRIATLAGRFTHEYPNVGLIATSRVVGYRRPSSWASYVELAITDLDDEQIADFVERWGKVLRDSEADEADTSALIEDIASTDGARELAGTPLLLTILVLLCHRGTRLPQRLSELFDLATVTLLREWPARRLGRSFDDRRMLAFLQPVALDLIASGGSNVGESSLLALWERAVAELDGLTSPREARDGARALLNLIEEHTGLFVEVGREAGERRYGFLHRSFAEYLAARELAEQWDSGDLDLATYLHVSRWQHVIEFLVGHIGQRGQAAASRIIEAILATDAPSERYLQRNVPSVVGFMTKGLEVRPGLRDEVVRRAIDLVVDPALEPLRTSRAVALADLARTLPASVSDAAAVRDPADSPGCGARKAWLRLLMRPDSEDRLGGFLGSIDDLLSGAMNGDEDVHAAMRAIGVADVDERDAAGLFFRIGGAWYAPDADAVERLARAGVPSRGVSDIAADPRSALEAGPWLVDVESFATATVGDIVTLLRSDDAFWPIVYTVFDDVEWHDARAAEIEILIERVEDLSPEVMYYAFAASGALEAGPGRAAWLKLAIAFITRGGAVARQLALVRYLTSSFGSMEDATGVIALAVARHPISARAVPVALAAQGGGAEPALVEIVETMVLSDPDPIARGLARRALAVTVRDEPLKILSSPDVAVPSEAMLVPYLEIQDTTGELLSLLLLVEDGDELQAAAAEIARRIIEVGTFVHYDLGAGDLYANSAFDRLGRESAYSDRPEVRAWATRILRSVERAPAPLELGRLLTDPDPRVRALAIDAIQEVDLRQARWIEDALLGYYALETGKAAAGLPAFLIANLPSEVLEDLIQLTEAYLDDHPGNPGALYLLESGRAIAHA